uniref:Uncharacterized protein n=1 Tax=Megaselia scalaris TaxID=36166 RepID=T1GJV7_MEGSC
MWQECHSCPINIIQIYIYTTPTNPLAFHTFHSEKKKNFSCYLSSVCARSSTHEYQKRVENWRKSERTEGKFELHKPPTHENDEANTRMFPYLLAYTKCF